MRKTDTYKLLKSYNQICKEADIAYHGYAKAHGLSDMAFWILYSLAESESYFTQRDFCNDWFFSPQTVNSALKDLEKKEIISLESDFNNKKNKLIKPTKKGEKFIEDVIAPLIRIECESLETLTKKERELMVLATGKYISALKENTEALTSSVPPK